MSVSSWWAEGRRRRTDLLAGETESDGIAPRGKLRSFIWWQPYLILCEQPQPPRLTFRYLSPETRPWTWEMVIKLMAGQIAPASRLASSSEEAPETKETNELPCRPTAKLTVYSAAEMDGTASKQMPSVIVFKNG